MELQTLHSTAWILVPFDLPAAASLPHSPASAHTSARLTQHSTPLQQPFSSPPHPHTVRRSPPHPHTARRSPPHPHTARPLRCLKVFPPGAHPALNTPHSPRDLAASAAASERYSPHAAVVPPHHLRRTAAPPRLRRARPSRPAPAGRRSAGPGARRPAQPAGGR